MTGYAFKHIFDIAISLTGLIVLSPLLICLAIMIKLDSPGPILYRGLRMGRGKKPFYMYKFRTMVANAEKIGGPSSADDDPRITQVGKFIRKYKLDELPQLFNVLKGTMSIVGPRPEVPEYAALYQDEDEIVYTVRPGITDYASLWNDDEGAILKGAGSTEEAERRYLEEIRPEKVRLQKKYVREQSLLTDLRIIEETIAKLFSRI